MALKIECYASHKADERPLRFSALTASTRTFEVNEVLDQWYGVGYQCFKIRADDDNLYILRHNTQEDCWTLDSFRSDHRERRR